MKPPIPQTHYITLPLGYILPLPNPLRITSTTDHYLTTLIDAPYPPSTPLPSRLNPV